MEYLFSNPTIYLATLNLSHVNEYILHTNEYTTKYYIAHYRQIKFHCDIRRPNRLTNSLYIPQFTQNVARTECTHKHGLSSTAICIYLCVCVSI